MKPRYKLRTLLILLAILPPLLWIGWTKYEAWKAEQERLRAMAEEEKAIRFFVGSTAFGETDSWVFDPNALPISSPQDGLIPAPQADLPPVKVPEEPRE
jgi:hypothetical protein